MGKIVVSSVGKAYKIYPNRWSRLIEWFTPLGKRHVDRWVLKDLNFTIEPGEAVGIVGINGAGKSTLLKMITGTTVPTKGNIQLTGSVAALLELGMGFHPEFTGRQNAYMAGQLLGYSKSQLEEKMESIIEFSEIGDYIDQPVRVYSSGMQMRLAFSVATAVRPDILIVDEALSVGDTYFQHKSFSRIRDFREQGTTLLIVSHDKQVIQGICDRAVLINGGVIEMEGNPETVMSYYNALLAERDSEKVLVEAKETSVSSKVSSGTGEVVISSISVESRSGEKLDVVHVSQPISIKIKAIVKKSVPELVAGFSVKDRLGQVVFGTNSYHLNQTQSNLEEGDVVEFNFNFACNIGVGSYSVSVALHSGENHIDNCYEWRDKELIFNIINVDKPIFEGNSWIDQELKVTYEHRK
ncbi:ABC transporter ATP-binding protein [Vibrio sp. JC009]|uniref:ABC transporter ATP-binding protein n=1 Tax=Vibrio sp. JC009 TaxID=2912314 RepID=UPI0023AE79DF|nr:ABC transporter ATP-binding protein [Vibrio sp. JC009]WED21996.1 ABC transporter ATP-binding protein [Vibrio sp. JC009]